MPSVGSEAAKLDLLINQGADFSFELQLTDSDDVVVALAGSTFLGHIRRSKSNPGVIETLSGVVNLSTNKVAFFLSNVQTSAISAGDSISDSASKYVYDIEWTKPGGIKVRILEGVVTVSREVTR